MCIGKIIIDIVRPRSRDSDYGISFRKKNPFGSLVIKYNMFFYIWHIGHE